jgi:hypothetical protein
VHRALCKRLILSTEPYEFSVQELAQQEKVLHGLEQANVRLTKVCSSCPNALATLFTSLLTEDTAIYIGNQAENGVHEQLAHSN